MVEPESTMYKVVLNHDGQYSIWSDQENVPGWSDAGKSGSKMECLDHIKDIGTDTRPAS
jgi:MbtH protein